MRTDARTGRFASPSQLDGDLEPEPIKKAAPRKKAIVPPTNYGPENWEELLEALNSQKAEADRLRAEAQALKNKTGFEPLPDGFVVVQEGYTLQVSGGGHRIALLKGADVVAVFDLKDNIHLCSK